MYLGGAWRDGMHLGGAWRDGMCLGGGWGADRPLSGAGRPSFEGPGRIFDGTGGNFVGA